MTPNWLLAAELHDTLRTHRRQRELRECIYCGHLTRALNRVCLAHDDLPALESAGELTRSPARPGSPADSSAAEMPPPGCRSRVAALALLPTGD